MEPTHEPGHGYLAINRTNIAHLRNQRDRAGLQQLADVLAQITGPRAYDAATLIDEARAAIAWLDSTTPRTYDIGEAAGIRIGDILRYTRNGGHREGIVLTTDGHTATTNHGDTVAL